MFAIVGCMAILLCLPGIAAAGGSPNPPIPSGLKLNKPGVQGILIIGWKYAFTESGVDIGVAEAFLKVEDKIYAEIRVEESPENAFIALDPSGIIEASIPDQLIIDFEKGNPALGAIATILEENDVSNFRNQRVGETYIPCVFSDPISEDNYVIGETSTAVARIVQVDTFNDRLIVDNVVGNFIFGETLLESLTPNYLNDNVCSLTGNKIEEIGEFKSSSTYRHIVSCDVEISFLVPKN
jgi:hypothetical protein